jgi:hypothetical protein
LVVLALLFAALFVGRVGAARRALVAQRWPAVALAGAAILAGLRGLIWPALALGAIAALLWIAWPHLASRRPPPIVENAQDAEARAVLGVGATATAAEIRAAYRSKMAHAHPDRGGAHADAARLTAARDRLLKKLGG